MESDTPVEQIKKRYRSLSFLVHPDKNQDDKDRAQSAFEAVNRAWKILECDLTRKRCLDIYEEAKDRTDLMVSFISMVLMVSMLGINAMFDVSSNPL